MADRLEAAERALANQGGLERRDGSFRASSTPFDATVTLEGTESAVRYELEMELPTLDAIVADETVADVVLDGWFDTLDRRLADLDGALRVEAAAPQVVLDEATDTVTVIAAFESSRPAQGAEDTAALVGFVEGTYMEGLIPGYTYREPVAGLLEQARERSGAEPPE
ncbi:MAG: DUF5813 family protein [Halobacteriales archaeon]